MSGIWPLDRIMHARSVSMLLATLLFSTFYACSITKPPTDALAKAELGVRAADEARAAELAPADLKNAQDKLAQARRAMAGERYDDARRLAESAEVDAELAEAKAEAEVVRRAADRLQKTTDAAPTTAERESRKPLTDSPAKE
jgi:membrane protein involved in colicin uptake